jgi:hypothetical protein
MAEMNRTSLVQGMGSPGFNLPYRSGSSDPVSLPLPPKNVHVTSPYLIGVLDIRWDNPAAIPYNSGLDILGVNVYRCFDTPAGEYTKINVAPLSAKSVRDQTSEVFVEREDVLNRLNPANNAEKKWFFHTMHKPLIAPGTNSQGQVNYSHILIEVDAGDGKGYVPVIPFKIHAEQGLIYLNTNRTYDPIKNAYVPPVLPDLLTGGIRVSYTYLNGLIATDMHRKLYYKVTTVAFDPSKGVTIETPISEVEAQTPYQMEKTDWVWKEAIRKNKWLLEREGERVKLFLRKWNGQRCGCYNEDFGYSKGVGLKNGGCPKCYGTGYIGGYEGPYDILIAPPETEKAVNLMDAGFHITYDWNTWTGPEPLLNDRDVVVRANNDRYFVNRPNPQGSRGAIYQQHFTLAHVDQTDPIYLIPIRGGESAPPEAWNAFRENRPSDASPTIPEKSTVPEGVRETGRTVTFENITL